jgi:hypothetical protein
VKAGADVTDVRAEKFGPTNGRVPGALGVGAILVAAVAALVDGWHASDPLLLSCLALASLLIWVVMFRPSVRSDGSLLHLRNMVSTTTVPLPLIDKVLVGAMLLVRVGETTYKSIALQRSRRKGRSRDGAGLASARGGSHQHTVMPMGSIAKEFGDYCDFVEDRITYLADEARVHRRGVDEPVRRTWAWPEIVGIVVLALVILVELILL